MRSDKLILGTVQFGLDYGINNSSGKPAVNDVFDIFFQAALNGINILDTADGYGNASSIIGSFHSVSEHRFLVNTKFKALNDEQNISTQLSQSIDELQVDFINVYFYHDFNDMARYPSLKEELLHLKSEGLVKKVGVSVYDNEQLKGAVEDDHIDVIQLPFNLLDNFSKRGKWLTSAKESGKEIQVRSVFLQGLFFMPFEKHIDRIKPLQPYIKTLQTIAEESSMSMAQLAMAYVLGCNYIDNVIIGIDNLGQLSENIKYSDLTISEEIRARIDSIDVKEAELLYPYNWH